MLFCGFPPLYIKNFYHVHDFHDDASDSSLAPFVTSQKIDIQSDDNEALQHYLTKYSDIIPTSLLETESKVQTISLKQDSLQQNNLEIQEQLQTVSKRVDDLFWVLKKQSD